MPEKKEKIVFDAAEQIAKARSLLTDPKRRIVFFDPTKGIDRDKMPKNEIDYTCNVYAIWSDDQLMYIGEAKNLRERLRQHFLKCAKSTESKLKRTLAEKRKNRKLSVSVIKVEPIEFRIAVEQSLIAKFTDEKLGGNPNALPWNKQGSKRLKK